MENREQIKNRMVKTAARLWGYSEDETESAFDPLVNILFSACSLELEKVSNEIHSSRARLLERMVQLLSPEVLCGPFPAHAVLHAKSIDNLTRLRETDQFFWTQKSSSVYESNSTRYKDIFFAPTSSFQVNAASVSYLATGHQLFRYREMISKEVITHCIPGRDLSASVLWLGITGPMVNLHNTQCYFDIRNEVNRELFHQNLPYARWYYGDSAITIVPGFNQEGLSGEQLDVEQLLTQKNTALYKIKEHVNAFYKQRFITLKYPELTAAGKGIDFPAELRNAFDKKDIQDLQKENVRWIKIQFPENISNAVLQDVICHFNCFPVINSQLHELTHHMHDMVNIIPLYSSDTFFDLNEISDHDGKSYNIRTIEKNVHEKLTVILRQGGIGRFDERDAASIIENIIQMLSDESAAFAVLGRDFLASEMKQLQQIIYKLEQQLQSRQLHRESTPFLVVRPTGNEKINNLLITYWSTTGGQANDIKAGTPLMSYKTGGLYQSNCTLVSTTMGGRDRLSATESITAYKSALLSRDRLISMEDIKVFCQLQMGSMAKEIEVTKGVTVPRSVSQGFARTIDVTIRLDRKSYMDAQEKNRLPFWKENLAMQLSKKSAGLTPFRVFIEQM
jgi:hypothetical protein